MHRHSHPLTLMSRRSFLVVGGTTAGSISLNKRAQGAPASARKGAGGKATSTILIWLSGGASHIDMFDLKPEAPAEYRGEFRPIPTSAPGVEISEHLPMLARQAHHLALVRSLGHFHRGTGDHHAGYYYNLTGHAPDPTFPALLNARKPLPTDWPYLGTVVAKKRPPSPHLPGCVTLPQKPGAPEYTRPGQFAARLGLEWDPVYVLGQRERPMEFSVPALSLAKGIEVERLADRRFLLGRIDASVRAYERTAGVVDYGKQQERAFSLLASSESKRAFDLSREPAALRERYGGSINGMSMLLARRLVEAGVPFVGVFWHEDPKLNDLCKSAGGWDTHASNFVCLRDHLLPEFDRSFSALVEDLELRGLLDQTVVMVTSEMGRKPRIGDPRSTNSRWAGRDHWTHCMTAVLAGGGIRGGVAYGSSDQRGEYPLDRPVAPEDVTKTIYHAMGIEDLSALDREGRPFDLLAEGSPILELF